MGELAFRVVEASAVAHAASPLVSLCLEITTREPVRALSLRCQAQIEATRRGYDAAETARLAGVFGEDHRFEDALRALLWAHLTLTVPAFEGRTTVELLLPCTPDLRTDRGTYLLAIEEGTIPLSLLFSGTVFHASEDGSLRVLPIPWSAEARFDLPARTCRQALEAHHGELELLSLSKPVVDRLQRFRVRRALAGIEQAITALLDRAEERS